MDINTIEQNAVRNGRSRPLNEREALAFFGDTAILLIGSEHFMSSLGEPDATISQLRDSLNKIIWQRRHEAERIVDAGMLELDEIRMKELAAEPRLLLFPGLP